MKRNYVIGLDEVGRGSLAGPVTVAAFALPEKGFKFLRGTPFRDSKRLTKSQRKEWFSYLKTNPLITYTIAHVRQKTVDRINISAAANTAALRAYTRLIKRHNLGAPKAVWLDGGLYLGKTHARTKTTVSVPFLGKASVRVVTKGDQKIPSIQLASIVAKVTRDRLMTRLAKQYPAYGFEIHKGYGTVRHIRALRKHGASPIHRLTFLKKYPSITRLA